MKIRIKGNSIRLRLTKTDVANLDAKGLVKCKTVISNTAVFSYSLKVDEQAESISADFTNDEITLFLPKKTAEVLTKTSEITVKGWQENGDAEKLFLLIEKDLQCLDPTHEDQSDMYKNTKSVC